MSTPSSTLSCNPSTGQSPATNPLTATNSKTTDTPAIQSFHQQAYQRLLDAYTTADAVASQLTDTKILTAVMAGWSNAQVQTSIKANDMSFYNAFANALISPTPSSTPLPSQSSYGYTDSWKYSTTTTPSAAVIGDFFNFALSRVPQATYNGGGTAPASQFVLSSTGAELPCATSGPYSAYKTYYDFHVSRLAQLVTAKVMFSLAMAATNYSIHNNTSSNTDQLATIAQVITKIESDLTANIDTQPPSDPTQPSPENIYLLIKDMSNNNLTSSQNIAMVQDQIAVRSQNLQTALNAEMQIDTIKWWAAFMMWLWVFFFIVGFIVVLWSLLNSQFIVVYVLFGLIVSYEVVLYILKWFGINTTYFNIQGIDDSIVLALGLPGLNYTP